MTWFYNLKLGTKLLTGFIVALHADLEPILGDTQGLMIYQESMMRVAQKFAGYSLAEADNLRGAFASSRSTKTKLSRLRPVGPQ